MLSTLLRCLQRTKRLAARKQVRASRISRSPYLPKLECLETRTVPTLTLSNIQIAPATILLNAPATLSGTVADSDPAATLTLQVNWGDGSTPQTFTYAAATTSFSQAHTFVSAGTLPLSLTLTDSDANQATASPTIAVMAPPPTISNVHVTPALTQNGLATVSGNLSAPLPQDTFTQVVNWGDSSLPQTFNFAAGTSAFTETHVYTTTGAYSVNLGLGDSDHTGGTLYGADVAGDLMQLNLSTGAGTLVGELPRPDLSITEIAYDNFRQQAWLEYGSTAFKGQQFNIATAGAIGGQISNLPGESFTGMVFDGETLYASGITSTGGTAPSDLRILNPATGTSTLIGMTGISGPLAGLAFGENSGGLYGIRGGNVTTNNLVTLNLSTGVATPIMSTGFAAGSLAFGPDGNLYAGSNTGLLYRINLSSNSVTLVGPTGFGSALSGLTLVDALPKTITTTSISVYPTPTLNNVQIAPSTIAVNGQAAISGTFGELDSQAGLTLQVNWGDGSAPQTFTYPGGTTTFTAPHTFLKTGSLPINLTLTNSDGGQATTSSSITVMAPPDHFSVSAAVASTVAGNPLIVTVSAQDQANNLVSYYNGLVHFTSMDSKAVLPADFTLTNGVGLFSVTLKTAASQTLTVTDPANSISSTSAAIAVGAAAATTFVVTAPSSAIAGTALAISVVALDPYSNLATGYGGTIHFTSNDGIAALPADSTLTNGAGSFTAMLKTAGSETITATDSVSPAVTATSTCTVNPAPVSHFGVSASGAITAGDLFVFSVTALDQFNNAVAFGPNNYNGTVKFTSSDTTQGLLPTNKTLTNGQGLFAASLRTAGPENITVTDTTTPSITGTSSSIAVAPVSPPSRLVLDAPANTAPGAAFTITVTAQDQFNNTVTNYGGTVHFSGGASRPADYTFVPADNGVHVFTNAVTLTTAPNGALTVTDTVTSSITGAATVNVGVGSFNQFVISAPTIAVAGNAFVFTVTAEDAFHNTVTAYAGVAHFTSNDPQASLPVDSTLHAGVGFFAAQLRTSSGNDTITATDTQTPSFVATSAPIAVGFLAANHFVLTAPTNAVTSAPTSFNVAAKDPFNNTVTTYSGTAHLTSSDPLASLPTNTTLTGGSGTFSVTFKTSGSQTILALDSASPSIAGTSSKVNVASLAVTSFTFDSSSFTVGFNEAFVLADLNLYDLPLPGGPLGPSDVTVFSANASPANGPVTFHGSLIPNSTNTAFTFIKTSDFNGQTFEPATGAFAPGIYTLSLRSAANGFHDSLGNLLADGNGMVGNNFVTTFTVTGPAPAIVGVPSFARGPGNTVSLPNNAVGAVNQGIPINLGNITNSQGVTSGTFTLTYNPQLLDITGAAGITLPGGNIVSLNVTPINVPTSQTTATATITFSSTTALPNSSTAAGVRLGVLLANVPNTAASSYSKATELSITSASLNGGVAVQGGDAVEVSAYLGDASGDAQLSGGDSALISQVANASPLNGTLPGFPAYRLKDPVIIADLNGNGSVDAPDVTLMNSLLSGAARAQVPPVNPNGLTISHLGPDPTLSLPTDLVATAGSTVLAPVNIDTARPLGSTGLQEAVLALDYDPRFFMVSASDIRLGSLTRGWQLQTAVNAQTGEIGIDLFSNSPIQTTASGNLVTITLHVRETAPAGSTGLTIVNESNPNGQRTFQTALTDAQGVLVLHTAIVDSGQWRVNGSDPFSSSMSTVHCPPSTTPTSSLSTVHRPPSTYGVVEQVFEDLVLSNVFGQPSAILNSELSANEEASVNDPGLWQQIGAGQHDWAPADMMVSVLLDQTDPSGASEENF